jgi:hypothetical protein
MRERRHPCGRGLAGQRGRRQPAVGTSQCGDPDFQAIRRRPEGEVQALLTVVVRHLETSRQEQGRAVVLPAERVTQEQVRRVAWMERSEIRDRDVAVVGPELSRAVSEVPAFRAASCGLHVLRWSEHPPQLVDG